MNIQDKVKTVEDACNELGLNIIDETPFAEPKNDRQIAANSFHHAQIVTEALNEGWVPDYENNDERKWEIWWDMESEAAGGSGFSLNYVGYCYSYSIVGARLVFKSAELARYAANQFKAVYRAFLTK